MELLISKSKEHMHNFKNMSARVHRQKKTPDICEIYIVVDKQRIMGKSHCGDVDYVEHYPIFFIDSVGVVVRISHHNVDELCIQRREEEKERETEAESAKESKTRLNSVCI